MIMAFKIGDKIDNKGEKNPFYGKRHVKKTRKLMSEARKGKIPWNKGKKMPESMREKMRIAGRLRKGEKAGNWQGGITTENHLIRTSVEYRLWREAVFARDNFTCQKCGDRGCEFHADHIKPFALFPELRTSIDNGRTLCVPCHKKTETYGKKFFRYKKKLLLNK